MIVEETRTVQESMERGVGSRNTDTRPFEGRRGGTLDQVFWYVFRLVAELILRPRIFAYCPHRQRMSSVYSCIHNFGAPRSSMELMTQLGNCKCQDFLIGL